MNFWKERSFLSISLMFWSSKYLTIDTYSLRPFLLLVFTMNYLASSVVSITSSGFRVIFSSGSPGTICQWSKIDKQKA